MNVPGGKGCKSRPMDVSKEEFDKSFENIFGKKEPKQVEDKPTEQPVKVKESELCHVG